MRRSELGYAVLLSVPVGVGVALAVYQTTGDFPGNPLALGGGLLTIVAIFALVVLGVRSGPDAPMPDAPRPGVSGPDATGPDAPPEGEVPPGGDDSRDAEDG